MSEQMNLWNVDMQSNVRKTRNVIAYIEKLEPPVAFTMEEQNHFYAKKREALSKLTADEMLETIGYKPNGRHKILGY